MKNLLLILFLIQFTACKKIPFLKDTEFISSAVANSPEYLITVNDKICRDTDGIIGLCAKRLKSTENLKINIRPQPYGYTFKVDCTDVIKSDESYSVLANTSLEHIIKAEKFSDVDVFNCTFDIIPTDRDVDISAFAAIRIYVVDAEYKTMDTIIKNGEYLILGRHSYIANVCGETKKETTALKTDCNKATVESYKMRMSYFNE